MLELLDITKVYSPGTVNENRLFDHFSLSIPRGQFVSVVGSNGSGKTSLLNLICGSIQPDGGKILMEGRDVTRMKEYRRYRTIGRVYQDPARGACGGMTLLENMAMADNKNRPYSITPGVNRRRVQDYRDMLRGLGLGLEDKMNIPVGSLSGGQRQAVALLMSTLTPIRFLILDEHTAALDPKTADLIMRLTGELVKQKGLTTLMVTHNLRYALEYGDRLLMMHEGKAVIDKSGPDKHALQLDDILGVFNQISIECGN